MDRYIGLDAHASSCTVAVVGPSGRRLHSQVVETNAGALEDRKSKDPTTSRASLKNVGGANGRGQERWRGRDPGCCGC